MAKQWRFTREFKAEVVLGELTRVKDKAEICRVRRLTRSTRKDDTSHQTPLGG